jgi:putative molybdopterin biosynthesis protein
VTLDVVADRAGLGFLPLQCEQYDFVVPIVRADRPPVAAFKALLREPSTRAQLRRLGMQVPDRD